MPTEFNKGRAEELIRSIDGVEVPINELVIRLARILHFLLARYIDGK